MKHAKTGMVRSVFLVLFCFLLLPLAAQAGPKKVTCGNGHEDKLQRAIDKMDPGDTLVVKGTCKENVVIHAGHRDLNIESEGATIDGTGNMNTPAVRIFGRGINIKGFTIIGGRHGVQYLRGGTGTVDSNNVSGATTHGVLVNDNSFARIVDSFIHGNGVNGICVCEHSSAEIGFRGDFATSGSPNEVYNNGNFGILVNDTSYAEIESNTVYSNTSAGIGVNENSSARIGYQSGPFGSFASANTIKLNGNRGILVARSSTARIVENIIKNNTGDGVGVSRVSQADIAANTIEGNTRDGISVGQNSGVNLGNDTGITAQDLPNNTIVNNTRFGISCFINSYADGRQGTLNGNSGPQGFDATCVNSLNP